MADLTKLSFYSEVNYLKRDDDLSGQSSISLTTSQLYNTYVIEHNLGYVPFYTFAAELENDGVIWSTQTTPRNIQDSGGRNHGIQMFSYAPDLNTLVLAITNSSPPVNASIDIYWAIYLDYGT